MTYVQRNARNEAIALQAKAKAIRESQKSRIDPRHRYILSLVANRVSLEQASVEDFMLDGDQVTYTIAIATVITIISVCSWTCLMNCLREMAQRQYCFIIKMLTHQYQV